MFKHKCFGRVEHEILFILHQLLTVRAAVDVGPESNPAAGVPFEGNKFEKAGSDGLAELVKHYIVGVHVPHQSLGRKERKD